MVQQIIEVIVNSKSKLTDEDIDSGCRFYFNNSHEYHEEEERLRKLRRKQFLNDPKMVVLMEVQPRTDYYHYSNPTSQNALICETSGFPEAYDKHEYECHSAYSDRLQQWDAKHYDKLCKLIGAGDQVWAYTLSGKSQEQLKKIAQFAFNLKELPEFVRFIHCFNVATGYSCPVIEAICKKKGTNEKH